MTLKSLLEKYISGKIRIADYKELKRISSETSDKELTQTLETMWMESGYKPMDSHIKEDVRISIRSGLRVEKRNRLNWRNIAVAVLLPALFLSTLYLLVIKDNQPIQEFVVASAKGQKTEIYLPDGTKVWLNSGSNLSYNSDYNHNNRLVKLKGEAFFDVQKNETSKFIVEIGDVRVVVHGTAFNISAYESDSLLSVSLNRGKVKVENTTSHFNIGELSPNQQIIVNKRDLSSQLQNCDADLQSLWTQNKLKLENATTEELFKKMEYWYGVSIHLENVNVNNKYALTIKTESLREMLDLINKLTPIKYTISGEEVKVRYAN